MSPADLPALTIADLQSLLRRREVSPREVLHALRARIEQVEPSIDAYLSFDFDAAAAEADKAKIFEGNAYKVYSRLKNQIAKQAA